MKNALFLVTVALICLTNVSIAQDSFQPEESQSVIVRKNLNGDYHPMNIFKTNLMGIVFNNYTLTYQRVLNQKFVAGIEVRMMPSSGIPFLNQITKGSDDLAKSTLADIRISGFGITPEIRIHPGLKGYGRGFYIGAFYRNSSYKAENLTVTYDNAGKDETINLTGNLNTNTFGIIIGKQWILGKHFVLDWIIFGAQYGRAKGTFDGYSTLAMDPSTQQEVRNTLSDLGIPFVDEEITVTDHTAQLKLSGPWAGLRSGLSIGFCF